MLNLSPPKHIPVIRTGIKLGYLHRLKLSFLPYCVGEGVCIIDVFSLQELGSSIIHNLAMNWLIIASNHWNNRVEIG